MGLICFIGIHALFSESNKTLATLLVLKVGRQNLCQQGRAGETSSVLMSVFGIAGALTAGWQAQQEVVDLSLTSIRRCYIDHFFY